MKVKIGDYPPWFTMRSIARWVCSLPFVTENRRDELEESIAKIPYLDAVLDYINSIPRKQKVVVKIDVHDTWNVDITLSKIVVPLLEAFMARLHGYALVADEDVPAELGIRSSDAPVKEYDEFFAWDANAEARYTWMLEEVLWAWKYTRGDYDEAYKDDDAEKINDDEMRCQKGMELFGKYVRCMWI